MTSLNQLMTSLKPAQDKFKPAAMLQNKPNQHMLFFNRVLLELWIVLVWYVGTRESKFVQSMRIDYLEE